MFSKAVCLISSGGIVFGGQDLRARFVLEWLQDEATSWHMMSDLCSVMSGIITNTFPFMTTKKLALDFPHRSPRKRGCGPKIIIWLLHAVSCWEMVPHRQETESHKHTTAAKKDP